MPNIEIQTALPRYWCANFNVAECLKHGIEKKLWMMQYQYSDSRAHTFQGDRKGAIRRNWKQAGQINEGDWLVAYLKPQTFYSIGRVILPRRPKSPDDFTKTVDEYLNRKSSHDHTSGYVYYTSVLYEDFSDPWRRSDDPLMRYAQRIDVDQWRCFDPDGVSVIGLKDVRLYDLQNAVFQIDRQYFEKIKAELVAACGADGKKAFDGDDGRKIDERIQEVVEEAIAKSQGFVQDAKVRRALEEYAMSAASNHFASSGYTVEDCSKNHPYDLCCQKHGSSIYVEVKGTQTTGSEILLTPGEVQFAAAHQAQMVLFVLHSISVSPETKALSGGQQFVVAPWIINSGALKPVSYKYTVGDSEPHVG